MQNQGSGRSIRFIFSRRITAAAVAAALLAGAGHMAALRALPARHAVPRAAASLSGTVTDPTGAVVPGAKLELVNVALHTEFQATTNGDGLYSFPDLPVGRYDLTLTKAGFKSQQRQAVGIDADAAVRVDVQLQVGDASQTVSVSAENDVAQVETAATNLGEVVSSHQMVALPLNGRSYTDLLAIQPGVTPASTLKPDSVIMAGVTGAIAPSGELNAVDLSINGQRESSNGFMVNGVDVREHMNGGTSIVPNLDSILEFRVLTSNFDPEFGNYNGGMVDVVTRSGSNHFHGNAFEFLRNTDLDARNYFAPTRAAFQQNQFGGTAGGVLPRHKGYFFTDYQGTHTNEGVDSGLIAVPTAHDRAGNLADLASSLTGTVNGGNWASLLSQKLGYNVTPGEAYYTPGCTTTSQCVLPGAVIPTRAWSAPATQLLQYIPGANSGAGLFSTSAYNQTVRDDKGSARLDEGTRLGQAAAYYFWDGYRLDNPYPGQQGGASVPGFDALTLGRAQMLTVGDSAVFGGSTVNEFHAGYLRNANNIGLPRGGAGVSTASQGFATGPGTPGIVVQAPQFEGVENISFNAFVMGVTITGVDQKNNTFYGSDAVSATRGKHNFKFGAEVHVDQVNEHPNATFNGTFNFHGTETGSDLADFLLGIPSNYTQSAGQPFYLRNKYAGFFGQDSWRVSHSLTMNLGLRWEPISPWSEKYNQIQTVVPGEQSVVYPGAPNGLVFPGDPGIGNGLAPTSYKNFAPRIGAAYAPHFNHGFWKTLFGRSGASSLRASYGIFYTAFPGLTAGIMYAVPPFGYNYLSPEPPLFATPFINAADGVNNGQRFPLAPVPQHSTAQNPDNNINWANFIPVSADPFFSKDNKTPYTDNYMLSFQRQLSRNAVLTLSYVGNQGHRLLVLLPVNPGNAALCLSLSQPSEVAPGTPTCGPFGEDGTYTTAAGKTVQGTRAGLGPNYGSMTAQKTIGNSNYNALETNVRYIHGDSQMMVAYTYSKSMDDGSNIGEQMNPFNRRLSRAISSFDLTQNLVVSYSHAVPFDRMLGRHRLTSDWRLSGTARFSTGFPVTLFNPTDNSLLGTLGNGVNNYLLDTPNVAPGPLNINTNPRNGQAAFNASLFSVPSLGDLGNTSRRFFYGPGEANYDMELSRSVRLSESKALDLRIEGFNVFNHAQFFGPATVEGNITSPSFGQVTSADAPRLAQVALKFSF